jgi:alpha-L-fucosidase
MMATYLRTSPWYDTKIVNNKLDFLEIRPVAAEDDDFLYKIESQYTHRPDLLAFDLYGTSRLWWVFAQRNMDIIKDPIYDFVPGTRIYIPKKTKLFESLGL